MGKNKNLNNALNDLMGSSANNKIINNTVENNVKKSVAKNFTFRLENQDRNLLENHFKDLGMINLSTGIRMVLSQYMKTKGIK